MFVSKNLKISDLIGQNNPCSKSDNSKSNEILKFKDGILVEAFEKGRIFIFDCINETNPKKNNEEEKYFDLDENKEKLRIPIYKNFRMIFICSEIK